MTPRRTEPVACASPMRRCPCRPAFFAQPSHRNAAPDPLHSVMAANVPSLVGAGHAPPVGTSLLPETLRIAMDRNPIRRGRIAGHPRGLSGPQAHCAAALFRDSRKYSPICRGRIAGHPCGLSGPQEHPPATPYPAMATKFPPYFSPLSTLHSPPNIPPIPRINTINLSSLRFIPKNALFLGFQI